MQMSGQTGRLISYMKLVGENMYSKTQIMMSPSINSESVFVLFFVFIPIRLGFISKQVHCGSETLTLTPLYKHFKAI